MKKPDLKDFESFCTEFDHISPLGWPLQRDEFPQDAAHISSLLCRIRRTPVGSWLEAERRFKQAEKAFCRTRFYQECTEANKSFASVRFAIDVGCALYAHQLGKGRPVKTDALREAEKAAKRLLDVINQGVGFASPSLTRDLYWRLNSFRETCKGYLDGSVSRPFPGRDDRTLNLRWLAHELAQRFNRSFGFCMPQVILHVLEIEAPGVPHRRAVEAICRRFEQAASNTPGVLRLREFKPPRVRRHQ